MFSGSSSTSFNPGEIKHFDLGFTTAYNLGSNHLSIVDTLKQAADVIRQFYNQNIAPGEWPSAIRSIPETTFIVSIYPNPTNNNVTIESTDNIQTIQLMDIEGRVILHKTISATKTILPVNTLAKGVYLLNVQGVGASIIRKIAVE